MSKLITQVPNKNCNGSTSLNIYMHTSHFNDWDQMEIRQTTPFQLK
jgi:hypothetical protein